ncbi:MAG TPA: M14 metallopeptidase family protein [Bryobacteraceae bacterium]
MRRRHAPTRNGLALAFLLAMGAGLTAQPARPQKITTPEEFFGFRMGADNKMARWDKLVEYYQLLEKEAKDRVKVINMGPTTMGNPFLCVIITSPANLAKLDQLKEINQKIVDPRGRSEQEIKGLVAQGKAVVVQSMSLHATEIGGSQMAPELIYDLISREDEEAKRIRDNVVSIMVPSFNPDGEIIVTDWYRKTLDTPAEGSNPPVLYHKYAGHDNNRDAFQTNMVESQYMAQIMFTGWKPEAYVDHHHMGSYGARIYLPPYAEPVRPSADPLLWRELSWYGAHMAYKEEEAGESGAINMAQYSGWGHFGFHWITPFHNIAGMLTESASAKLASPLYIHPEQLEGGIRNLPTYDEETVFPDPWKGGWWRLRDIVDRQKTSAWAVLDLAARNKETVLWNAYLKGKRQTERGAAGKVKAYVIPVAQHDKLTAELLVNKLLVQGVEVQKLSAAFSTSGGMTYPAGSYVVTMAQPKMGLVRYLLGRTFFPDNDWTRNKDGSPIRPYDMSTDTMYEYMGVRVDPVEEPVQAAMTKLTAPETAVGIVAKSSTYLLDGRLNESYKAANLLMAKGASVARVDHAGAGARVGDFLVSNADGAAVADVAKSTGVDFAKAPAIASGDTHGMKPLRIGMYQRYMGGNIDEGWTRWVLEQFAFPYKSVLDPEIKKGNLNAAYDVLILPDDNAATLMGEAGGGRNGGGGGGGGATPPSGGGGGGRGADASIYPPEFRSGLHAEGLAALKDFVQKGGTLVALGSSSLFAIDRLGLGVRNVTAGKSTKEFWCPGSTLKINVETTNRYGYGMPDLAYAVFLQGDPAFDIPPSQYNEHYQVIANYVERDVLQSGWLVGEQTIAKKPAMIVAQSGNGKVVLVGFRTQHRAQTYGTFKLLFNTLVE